MNSMCCKQIQRCQHQHRYVYIALKNLEKIMLCSDYRLSVALSNPISLLWNNRVRIYRLIIKAINDKRKIDVAYTILTAEWRVAWYVVAAAAAAVGRERRQCAACKRADELALGAPRSRTAFSHHPAHRPDAAAGSHWCAAPTASPAVVIETHSCLTNSLLLMSETVKVGIILEIMKNS